MAGLKKRNLTIIAAFILVIVIVLSSFLYLNFNSKSYAGEPQSITIGTLPNEAQSLIFVADNQKYFTANGLNITLKSYSSGVTALNGLQKGEADIAVTSEYVLVEAALENSSVFTFASLSKGLSIYLVGRTDRGINTVSDLKNKTIGVPFGTASEFYLGRYLELNGLNFNQVSLVNIALADSANALANGSIDAAISIQPYISIIQNQLESKVVTWAAQSDQPFYSTAVCMNDWTTAHPDLIIRFLKAMSQAETFTINHQDQAKAIVEKALNYTGTYLSTVWPAYQFSVSLDQAQLLAMQDEARWLIDNNLTNATLVPNFLNYVYLDGLEAVDPNAITIIH